MSTKQDEEAELKLELKKVEDSIEQNNMKMKTYRKQEITELIAAVKEAAS